MPLKIIFTVLFLSAFLKTSAQQIIVKGDTLILPNGSKFWLNEEVILGNGSAPDKSFNFIYEPEIFYIKKRKPLGASYYAKKATIIKFQRDTTYKSSYSYNIIVLDFGDKRRFWCDVQGAIDNNELVNLKTPASQAGDKNVKLLRLKKLYDSGEITKDEYELLKTKILNAKDTNTPNKKITSKSTVF